MWDSFSMQQSQSEGEEDALQAYTYLTNDTPLENDDKVLSMHTGDEGEEQFSEPHKESSLDNQIMSLFHIPQEVLNENPNFAKLLQTISNHISPDSGIGKGEEEELEHLEIQLEKEKERYFKNTIILDTIREMLDDRDKYGEPLQTTLSRMSSLLLKSEIEIGMNISDLSKSDPVNVYGLDSEILSDTINEKEFGDSLQTNILEFVYPELIQKWESLYEDLLTFYQPFPEEATNLFADNTRTSNNQFSHIISKHISSIKYEKQHILEQKQKLQEYTYTYFSKLTQCVQILCTLVNSYKCGEFRQYDESTISWLIERTEAMKLKLCSIKYEYLVTIYDKNTVPIYYKMHQILSANFNNLEHQNNQLNAEIKKYSSLGEDFEKLVEEFASVQKRISEKKWEIEQLHNPND